MPLVVLVVAAAMVASLTIGWLGERERVSAAASAAADAAALAGARDGHIAAARLARANGARVVEFERLGSDVRVTVAIGEVRATARARPPAVAASGAAGDGPRAGLAPAMQAALARAEQVLGQRVPVVSGRRTFAEQQRLWERRSTSSYPVARPGASRHESGLAIDVPLAFADRLASVSARTGLCRPFAADPVHFELCG